jgi:hypothetical protein
MTGIPPPADGILPGSSGHPLVGHAPLELLRPGGQVHDDVLWVGAREHARAQQVQRHAPARGAQVHRTGTGEL